MNLPNFLTLLRIFLVPVFLIAVLYRYFPLALVVFIVAGATDALDGFLARRLSLETRLGIYLDPLADKLLTTVSFISLAGVGLLPAWLAVVVVTKDLYVSIGVGICHFSGLPLRVAPTSWGKGSTFLQIVTVGLALVSGTFGFPRQLLSLVFFATGLLTLSSLAHYIFTGLNALPQSAKGE